MIKIKFRAWDIEEKSWIPGDQVRIFQTALGFKKSIILMQFINLTDTKGKEIYDRDIIKTGYLEDKGYLVGVIEYQKRSARWGIRVGYRLIEFGKRGRWYEIIGNTCENPKLLEEA